MDPTKYQNQARGHMVWGLVYDNLVRRVGGSSDYTPGLATSYKIVDNRTITFELRNGVKFSDGTPFNAAAVKFGLERNRDNQGAVHDPLLPDLDNVEVTGDLSVTIHLNKDVAGSFLDMLTSGAGSIVSPTAAKDPSIDLGTHPVGAGPYQLVKVAPSQVIELRRVDNNWDQAAWCFATIQFVHSALGPPRVNAWKAGLADAAEFSLSDLGGDLSIPGNNTIKATSTSIDLDICNTQAPFDNPLVRQALSYAVDRNVLNATNFKGNGQVNGGLFPVHSTWYDPALDTVYSYNPDKARQLLTQAGYPNGIKANLVFYPIPSSQRSAEAIQSTAKSAGFDFKLVPSSDDLVGDFFTNGKLGPVFVGGMPWGGLQRITTAFAPGYGGNACNYKDDHIQALQAQILPLVPTSPEAIKLAKDAAQYIIGDKALKVLLYDDPFVWAASDKVHNWKNSDSQGFHPDFRGVYMTR